MRMGLGSWLLSAFYLTVAPRITYDAHREQFGRARSHVCLRLIQRVHDSEAFLSPLNRDAMVEWLIAPGSE